MGFNQIDTGIYAIRHALGYMYDAQHVIHGDGSMALRIYKRDHTTYQRFLTDAWIDVPIDDLGLGSGHDIWPELKGRLAAAKWLLGGQ